LRLFRLEWSREPFLKKNIKERTLVMFLKKRNEKTHPFISKVESGKSKESESKNKKEKEC
jgi:hypothetical protein